MKKILVILALTAAATTASAVNPRIVTATGTFFPTSNISYYLAAAEGPLAQEAKAFCAEFNEKVAKISNINVQIQGEFQLKAGDRTEAVTHPHYVFSALVHCRE